MAVDALLGNDMRSGNDSILRLWCISGSLNPLFEREIRLFQPPIGALSDSRIVM
jgi:hypothetical protein